MIVIPHAGVWSGRNMAGRQRERTARRACICCHESVLKPDVSSSSGGRVRVLMLDGESVALCASGDPMKVLEGPIGVFDQAFRGCEKPNARSPSMTDASRAPAIGDCGSRLESTSPIAWL